MANFEIAVVEGEERQAMARFVQETCRFLYELTELSSLFQRVLFDMRALQICRQTLGSFGDHAGRAVEAVYQLSDAHIEAHALRGVHLEGKIRMVVLYHTDFLDLLTQAKERPPQALQDIGPLWRRALLKLLQCIDNLTESIGSGAPFVGAVTEMKKMLETAISD
ncbi:hypothetical protein [Pseudokordiimonas caeni]|uniref:hypothetical protein n=1 Tax=Pseudokordiimonas caeni TaxID=2997908 RepID=UPI002810BB87|nr:hypothetical protein [Pseudokordiimonas caeni]